MGLFARKQQADTVRDRRRSTEPRAMVPRVFSYHTRRSQELGATGRQLFRETITAENASKAARYGLRRFGVGLVIVVAFISLVNASIVSTDVKVLPLDTQQTHFLHDLSTYQQAARELFGRSPLNRSKVTIDTGALSAEFQKEFPELAVVSIKMPLLGHRPIMYIAPAQAVILLTTNHGRTYVVDEQGRALGSPSDSGGYDSLLRVKDENALRIDTGELVLPSDTVVFIRSVAYQLQAKRLAATFTLPTGKSELDMALDGKQYIVKFNLADPTNSSEQQVGTFLAVQHKLGEQGTTPAQYVDVRVAGRAYYQ